ncbi:DEAD-box ATP-dependent RNA helicase 52B-like [Phragmites australis]|uniref:DEAD-box ATP-dependent RNA helicase 52B-like n=1 Tax=Phragmites australis TaxID=29695 RepID=UPI002D7839CD|nr:DEAD-box ATP-dependent RNA helicase 52B-like [Phragmites australis]
MGKGDDALARKRNKVHRKRLRSSDNAVSERVAAIIASKRRRKSGKRRACEGMCFSLPTPDDPFNDRHLKKRKIDEPTEETANAAAKDGNPKKKDRNTKKQQPAKAGAKAKSKAVPRELEMEREDGRVECDRPSKFLVVCLNAIRDAVAPEDGAGRIHGAGDWGVELWRCCSAAAPCDVLDTSGACATLEQTAWLVSTACDIVARKERLGMFVSCPFLLYLVPSQEKAVQVRSICKPLKSLGIHSVSLHPGTSIEHQMLGLKSCEPEFLISTPERLLELISLKAIDISNVSMLVVDGLKSFVDFNVSNKLYSIRDAILSNPQITIFSDPYDKDVAMIARNLFQGRIARLSINDSITSRSAFIAQYVHFCPSEEQKTLKVKEILEQILKSHAKKTSKVLLVAATDKKAQHLSSSLKLENCTVTDDSHRISFTICSSLGLMDVLVKDRENIVMTDVEEFELLLVVDLPPSVDEYVEILTGIARHAVAGEVHSIFCNADAPIAKPLAEVLSKCCQVVPEFLKNLEP